MVLSINAYNEFEANALRRMSNAAQTAFAPSTFLELSCPVTVTDESDFLRFVDNMHEASAGDYFKARFPLSPDEGDLIRQLGDHVVDYTARTHGQPIRPWVAPLSALEMLRVVSAMAGRLGKRRVTVLEIGPGSGYFGSLLHLAGHRHLAMDITQAYYLWQNRLFESLAGDSFMDLADPTRPLTDDPAKSMIHLPWWRFVQLHEAPPFPVDFVVCDHALNEISTPALRYILRMAGRMLAEVKDGMFLFCYSGHGQKRDEQQLFREFDSAGYQVLFKRLFYGLGLKGSRLAPLAIAPDEVMSTSLMTRARIKLARRGLAASFPDFLALDSAIPRHNPSGRPGITDPIDCVPIRRAEEPPGYSFLKAAGYFVPPYAE